MTTTPGASTPPAEPFGLALLSLIAQESADCIKVLDLDARLLTMNENGQQAMEIDDFEVCRNLLWPDFWQGDDRLQVEAALDRARAGQRSTFEGQGRTFKGTPRWWEVRVAPVLDEQGAVRQLLAVSRDITARKQAELDLVALNADLERQVAERTRQTLQDAQAQAAFVAFVESVGTETDVLALARQASVVLCSHLSDASVGYYQLHDGRWKARVWSDHLPADLVAVITAGFPAELPMFAPVLATRGAVFIDAWDAEREGVRYTEAYGTAVNYPLLLKGEVHGILSIGLTQTRQWTGAGRALVQAVGRALNLALERAEDLRQLTERGAELESLNGVLRRERTFLQAVMQSMSEGLVACDEHGQLTLFNDATRTFHGLDASSLPPEQWAGHYDLFEGDGVTPMTTQRVPLYRAWQGESLSEVELVIRPNQGLARQLLASGGPIFTPGGQPLGAVVTMRDVTVRKAAEQQLRRSHQQLTRSNAELLAANEELEAFTYSVSHDLRTPVRHIISFGELLRRELPTPLDAKAERYFGIVSKAASTLNMLIDGMLDVSRTSRQPLSAERVHLERLFTAVRHEVGVAQPQRQIAWQIADLPAVTGDADLLRRVIAALVDNAVKYTRGREKARIEVWAEDRGQSWAILVRDNGVGFNPQYQGKLFTMFQRLHRQEDFEGAAVSLANARRIVTRHGGTMTAEGQPGAGATFGFILPKTAP
ncbi:PAS domain-containing protein [Deinococcus saxicola]|uniref:PAS domain-containing protein n=2 Tax=Deinococcus saxicola TaxID=249406 RepID=UPI0039F34C15